MLHLSSAEDKRSSLYFHATYINPAVTKLAQFCSKSFFTFFGCAADKPLFPGISQFHIQIAKFSVRCKHVTDIYSDI
jgi:hypothetical protein